MRRISLRAAAVAALLLLEPAAAVAGESYYVLIFGSQSRPKRLRYTHTWATFVRAVGEGPDPRAYALETITISWLPRTMEVKVLRPWPEPGVNLDLHQTLAAVGANGERVMMWGPFVMRRQIFERAARVRAVLESGRAEYRAISNARNLLVSDCIHAVAAVDPVFGRRHYPLIRIGIPASRYIARQGMTRSVYDQARYDNSWLIPRLGLDPRRITIVPPQQIPARSCLLCQLPDR
jgi:hypothetical protein